MWSPLNKNVKFVKEVVMLIKIVGSGKNHSATIVKSFDILKKKFRLKNNDQIIFPRSKKVKQTYFMLVKQHPSKIMMCGFLIVGVAIT